MHRMKRLCLLVAIVLAIQAISVPAYAGYKENFAELMNLYYGGICEVKMEGWLKNTLRIDWKSETIKFHVIKVISEVGDVKEDLYKDGVRYLKFPNDAGGYNIIDWKTGDIRSVNERAPYYFEG
jgi:hypothetical protein